MQRWGIFSGNLERIRHCIEQAKAAAADLVIFPEMVTSGYPPADLLDKDSFVQRAENTVKRIAELTSEPGMPAVLCGSPMRCEGASGKRVRNVAALLYGGEIRFVQQKMLLPFL